MWVLLLKMTDIAFTVTHETLLDPLHVEEAWNTFEQDVSTAKEADQDTLNHFVLTDDYFADFIGYGFKALCGRGEITHTVILCKKEGQRLSFWPGINPIRNFDWR